MSAQQQPRLMIPAPNQKSKKIVFVIVCVYIVPFGDACFRFEAGSLVKVLNRLNVPNISD